jgi:hypothetical protein
MLSYMRGCLLVIWCKRVKYEIDGTSGCEKMIVLLRNIGGGMLGAWSFALVFRIAQVSQNASHEHVSHQCESASVQFGVVVLAAIVLHKMFACCEVVPSGFVGLLWGMVCGEGGMAGSIFFCHEHCISMLFSLRACVCWCFSHCKLFFVLCCCFFVSL